MISPPSIAWAAVRTSVRRCFALVAFGCCGLFAATAPAPLVLPDGGTFASAAPLMIVPGGGIFPLALLLRSTVRYTIDGTDPDEHSPAFSLPLLLTENMVVKARTYAPGIEPSWVVSAAFVIRLPPFLGPPTVAPTAGIFADAIRLGFASPPAGAEIRYTLDGSLPSLSSACYISPLLIDRTCVLRARTFAWYSLPSPQLVAAYAFQAADPVASPPAGQYTSELDVSLTSATSGSRIRYTIDGSEPSASSTEYAQPVHLDRSLVLCARAYRDGFAPSPLSRATYELIAAQPTIVPAAGTYSDVQTLVLATATAGADIHYTIDGSAPDQLSPLYRGPFVLTAEATVRTRGYRAGFTASDVAAAAYRYELSAPSLAPVAGSYDALQEISIAGPPGAVVRYTLDGSEPDATGQVYAGPFTLDHSAVVTARAFRGGFEPSPVVVGSYTITAQAPSLSFAAEASQVREAAGEQRITVVLDRPWSQDVVATVSLVPDASSASAADLGAASGSVTIPAGATTADVVFAITNDDQHESDETAVFQLATAGTPLIGPLEYHTLTIVDDDPLPRASFVLPTSTVAEPDGQIDVAVRLDRPSSESVFVAMLRAGGGTASPDADYSFVDTRLVFAPGETSKAVRVAIHDDHDVEPDETAIFRLVVEQGAELGVPATHTLVIRSDERLSPALAWNRRARGLVALRNIDPAMASRCYALLSVAQYQAARGASEAGMSLPGAVEQASLACLAALFPGDAGSLRDAAVADLVLSPLFALDADGLLATDGFGARIARDVLAYAASDGSALPWNGVVPTGPGLWYNSWTYAKPPSRPGWGSVRPWFIARGDHFRPTPPRFGSPAFQAALTEIRTIADNRTSEQFAIAARWSDGPGTATPPGHWNAIAEQAIADADLDELATAHVLALLNATLMDAGIAIWDAKFTYWMIRPYQADPAISTPIGQPNFPSYVSGHSGFSGAAATILSAFFPDRAEQFASQADEASLSRMYGGIHYRFDCEDGLVLGRAVAGAALADDADGEWDAEAVPHVVFTAPAGHQLVHTAQPTFAGAVDAPHPETLRLVAVLRGAMADVDVSGLLVVNPDPRGGLEFTLTCAPLAEGLYALEVSATDAAGRTGSARGSIAVDLDGPPVVTILTPAQRTVIGAQDSTTVSGTVNQPLANLTINGVHVDTVASSAGVAFSQTMTVQPTLSAVRPFALVGGDNDVQVTASDRAGQSTTAVVTIVADVTEPSVRIESPLAGMTIAADHVAVSGMVHDVVLGSVNAGNAYVTVNGLAAEVDNGAFLAAGVPLAPGANTLHVIARDAAGNTGEDSVVITRDTVRGLRLEAVAGDLQTGVVDYDLPLPCSVRLLSADGTPAPSRLVRFAVSHGDGRLVGASDDDHRLLEVLSGADGVASATLHVGRRAGKGDQRIAVTAVGSSDRVDLVASATPGPVARLLPSWGNQQTGAAGQVLSEPLIVTCVDELGNPAAGASIRCAVAEGAGQVSAARTSPSASGVDLVSGIDGRVEAWWTMGPAGGREAQAMTFSASALPAELPVTMLATSATPGAPADTSLSGIVLSGSRLPVAGVTVSVDGTTNGSVSDAQGRFAILGVAPGHRHITMMGATANTDAHRWPNIGYETDLVAGIDNAFPMPLFLPELDVSGQTWVGGDQDVDLAMPGVLGAKVRIFAHSTLRADGTRAPLRMFVSPVNALSVPMAPPDASGPLFISTLQPGGTRLDPPAQVLFPNFYGLPPGAQAQLSVFDHDLGNFVSYGSATVTADRLQMISNPGTGIGKAGWFAFPPSSTQGTVAGKVPKPPVRIIGPASLILGQSGSYYATVSPSDPGKIFWSLSSSDSAPAQVEFSGGVIGTSVSGPTTVGLDYPTATATGDGAPHLELLQLVVTAAPAADRTAQLVVSAQAPTASPRLFFKQHDADYRLGPIHLPGPIDLSRLTVSIYSDTTGEKVSLLDQLGQASEADKAGKIVIGAVAVEYTPCAADDQAITLRLGLHIDDAAPGGFCAIQIDPHTPSGDLPLTVNQALGIGRLTMRDIVVGQMARTHVPGFITFEAPGLSPERIRDLMSQWTLSWPDAAAILLKDDQELFSRLPEKLAPKVEGSTGTIDVSVLGGLVPQEEIDAQANDLQAQYYLDVSDLKDDFGIEGVVGGLTVVAAVPQIETVSDPSRGFLSAPQGLPSLLGRVGKVGFRSADPSVDLRQFPGANQHLALTNAGEGTPSARILGWTDQRAFLVAGDQPGTTVFEVHPIIDSAVDPVVLCEIPVPVELPLLSEPSMLQLDQAKRNAYARLGSSNEDLPEPETRPARDDAGTAVAENPPASSFSFPYAPTTEPSESIRRLDSLYEHALFTAGQILPWSGGVHPLDPYDPKVNSGAQFPFADEDDAADLSRSTLLSLLTDGESEDTAPLTLEQKLSMSPAADLWRRFHSTALSDGGVGFGLADRAESDPLRSEARVLEVRAKTLLQIAAAARLKRFFSLRVDGEDDGCLLALESIDGGIEQTVRLPMVGDGQTGHGRIELPPPAGDENPIPNWAGITGLPALLAGSPVGPHWPYGHPLTEELITHMIGERQEISATALRRIGARWPDHFTTRWREAVPEALAQATVAVEPDVDGWQHFTLTDATGHKLDWSLCLAQTGYSTTRFQWPFVQYDGLPYHLSEIKPLGTAGRVFMVAQDEIFRLTTAYNAEVYADFWTRAATESPKSLAAFILGDLVFSVSDVYQAAAGSTIVTGETLSVGQRAFASAMGLLAVVPADTLVLKGLGKIVGTGTRTLAATSRVVAENIARSGAQAAESAVEQATRDLAEGGEALSTHTSPEPGPELPTNDLTVGARRPAGFVALGWSATRAIFSTALGRLDLFALHAGCTPMTTHVAVARGAQLAEAGFFRRVGQGGRRILSSAASLRQLPTTARELVENLAAAQDYVSYLTQELGSGAALARLERLRAIACFAGDTRVLLADGSSKPISRIVVGDRILTRPEDAPEAACAPAEVSEVFRHQVSGVRQLVVAPAGDPSAKCVELHATGSHPFWRVGLGWTPAAALVVGDRLAGVAGELVVRSNQAEPGTQETWNLGIADGHTYFVGGAGGWVWVHNFCREFRVFRNYAMANLQLDSVRASLLADYALSKMRKGEAYGIPGVFIAGVPAKLRASLKAVGRVGDAALGWIAGFEAHHLIPTSIQNNPSLKEFLARIGFDSNHAANGIFLPSKEGLVGAGTLSIHNGPHVGYINAMETALDKISVLSMTRGDSWAVSAVKRIQSEARSALERGVRIDPLPGGDSGPIEEVWDGILSSAFAP